MEFSGSMRKRFLIFLATLALLFTVVTLYYTALMAPGGILGEAQTVTQQQSVIRGSIFDRNGNLLATPGRVYAVTAWLPDVENIDTTTNLLSLALHEPAASIRATLESTSGFAYISRRTTENNAKAVQDYIHQGKLPGIGIDQEDGRFYPYKEVGAKVVGYTDTANKGITGIEGAFERILSPDPAEGVPITYGDDIYLTIDIDLQQEVERQSAAAFIEHNPDFLITIVMDAKSGEILASTSYPTFDPNIYYEFDDFSRLNHMMTQPYEPGSVFKIFSLASILNSGEVDRYTTYEDTGEYVLTFPNGNTSVIKNTGDKGYGEVTPIETLKHSLNTAMTAYSLMVEDEFFYQGLRNFGFGYRTYLPLGDESAGYIPKPSDWSGRSKPTIAFGQESLTTAIQLISGATAFANQGLLLEPQIIKEIVSPSRGIYLTGGSQIAGRATTQESAQVVLDGMEASTTPGGTGIFTRVEGVRVATKTGTGQKVDPLTKLYSDTAVIASTISIFPADDPQYILYGVMDTPRGRSIYGSSTVAPMLQRIIQYMVTKEESSVEIQPYRGAEITEALTPISLTDNTLPDLIGFSKREILNFAEIQGIPVDFAGSGWCTSQSIPPGTPLEEVQSLSIYLSP